MAEKKNEDGFVVETVKTVFWALLIAGMFRTLLFQPFYIPSGSMKSTLLIGDFLFVNKMVYGYSKYSCPYAICPISGRIFGSEPELGDVVVFRHPTSGQDYIKRLIGLPGDKVQFTNGVLFINGVEAKQTPDGQFIETYERQGGQGGYPRCIGTVGEGGDCAKDRFIETLPNGVEHAVLSFNNGPLDNTGIYTVPAGKYFFSGDNRDNSTDSRVPVNARGVGFLDRENIIGRAERVVFSSAGRSLLFFWTWRSDRFFKAIR